MRVQGASWDKVAEALGFAQGNSARTALCYNYSEVWAGEYEDALRRHIREDTEPLAILGQKNLVKMLLDESKIRELESHQIRACQAAAHSLLMHASRLRAQLVQIDQRHTIQLEQADTALLEEIMRSSAVEAQRVVEGLPALPPDEESEPWMQEEEESEEGDGEASEDIQRVLLPGAD